MYCLTCGYDLRGLSEHRCPECGRLFSLAPSSYRNTPRPDRVGHWLKGASSLLADVGAALEPHDPVARAVTPLRRQVARLAAENAALRHRVDTLVQLLADGGQLDPAAVAALSTAAELAVVDDTDDGDGDDPPPSDELLALEQAAAELAPRLDRSESTRGRTA